MAYDYAVALTGGIGTGKSTVCSLFKLMGFAIIDADEVAHAVLQEQAEPIRALFGEEVMCSSGVDRSALGKIVFSQPKERKKLEALLHPLIRKRIQIEATAMDKKGVPYLIDIPLFYESGHYPIEPVVVVYAPKAVQTQRVVKRDKIPETDALKRIESQMDIETKRAKATFVIDNSGSLPHLQEECERVSGLIKDSKG